jgi:hypothetical protein
MRRFADMKQSIGTIKWRSSSLHTNASKHVPFAVSPHLSKLEAPVLEDVNQNADCINSAQFSLEKHFECRGYDDVNNTIHEAIERDLREAYLL